MASQGTATSRLAQIQMRFQQKQLQVREQRKMEMTTSSKPTTSEVIDNETTTKLAAKPITTKDLNSTIGNGKVRQMFNERRRGAGIDRSNPLKPITSRSSSSSSTLTTTSLSSKNADHTITRRHDTPIVRSVTDRKMDKSTTKRLSIQKNFNSNDSIDYNENNENRLQAYHTNENDIDGESFPELHSWENFETELPSKFDTLVIENTTEDTNNNIKSRLAANIKLNPVLTKKSPSLEVSRTSGKSSRSSLNLTYRNNASPNSAPKTASSAPKVTAIKSQAKMKPSASSPVVSLKIPRVKTPTIQPPGTSACKICNRFFNEDRLTKHQEVCEKMAMKKRKIFDASKHRVKGTEAEKYLKKPLRGAKNVQKQNTTTSSTDTTSKKSSWRKKHEEFIAAIRAAKEVQAHLAKGGKLSDLPPPPPSENPDYVACPHCSRRFNEAAATRHIPKCANMLHNKPKPAVKRR